MRDRSSSSARAGRSAAISIELVLCRPEGRRLAVFLVSAAPARRRSPRERWTLPRASFTTGEVLDLAAVRAAASALGTAPAWLEQVGVFDDGTRTRAHSVLSVAYVGVTPGAPGQTTANARWHSLDTLPVLAQREHTMVDAALGALRERVDRAPIAFRLLPAAFTLSELQGTYELLLGRALLKASFRRALQAASLVEPADRWRREGRGRPPQLFRFAPRRREQPQRGQRGVRFEF